MGTSKSSGKSKRHPRRKRMELYLLNDNVNSFEYVINVLTTTLPMCNTLKAEQMAILVDGHGHCSIYSGFQPEIYVIYARCRKAGLSVQIREY